MVLTVQALSVPTGPPVAFQHRKRELCARVTTADWGTALVFAADITDRLRELHRNPAPVAPQRRAHYTESVALIHRRLPQLPWNAELRHLAHATLSDRRRDRGP